MNVRASVDRYQHHVERGSWRPGLGPPGHPSATPWDRWATDCWRLHRAPTAELPCQCDPRQSPGGEPWSHSVTTSTPTLHRLKLRRPSLSLLFLSVKCNFDRLYNHFGFCPCVCLSTNRLSNDYVRNSLPIFTKFCMPLRNVVVSNGIVSRTNRK